MNPKGEKLVCLCVAWFIVWLFCLCVVFVGLMLEFMLMVSDVLNRFT